MTVLIRTKEDLWLHVEPLDLIGRTAVGDSATWHPTGRPFWTLDTQPTLPERDEDWVDAPKGSLWDFGLLKPLFDELALAGSLVLDVGANIGTGAVYCGARGATVLAVEACKPTFDLLCKNIAANNLESRVHAVRWVAYDGPGPFCEVLPVQQDNAGAFAVRVSDSAAEQHLPGGPLDLIVQLYTLAGPVSLIKVDAQGCDLRVLRGLRQTIDEFRPVIIFEWEEDLATVHGDDWGSVLGFLAGIRYDCQESVEIPNNFIARPQK